MHTTLPLPMMMLIIFASAKLLAELAEKLGQPGIVGEILAGVLIGPAVFGWISMNETIGALSDLGVMFLLFRVGLEVKSSELLDAGPTAALVAFAGVLVPLAGGWALMTAYGYGHAESLFVGAALVATSVGITAQVLSAKGMIQYQASQIILAAAVIDDVLGLIVLAIVSSLARGRLNAGEIALTAILPIVFTFVIARWGTHGVRRAVPAVESKLSHSEAQFHLAMVLLFGLSVLALYTGVAAIVGAFLAGMSLGENVTRRVHDLVHGTTELLVPFFLAGIGLRIEPSIFANPSILVLGGILLLIAVVSKLIGCGLGALRLGRRDAIRVGVGMIPRGEVGMVVAQLGLSMGVLSAPVYGIVVFTALATTLVAPPLLAVAYQDLKAEIELQPAE
ncbi:MAG: cation:proton antiporter [Acidobacteria bacterium]|nr:cation:proton antiporter [Acidobacteriota bacterium]